MNVTGEGAKDTAGVAATISEEAVADAKAGLTVHGSERYVGEISRTISFLQRTLRHSLVHKIR